MIRPNFGNLESFCNRCAGTNSENIIVPRTEAQGIAREYQNLLAYTVDLQSKIIDHQADDVIELEIKSGSF